jgi:O-antigen ligase
VFSPYGVHTVIGYHRYEGLFTIALYVLTFFFVCRYGRPGKWLLFLFAASMTVFCLICFVQLFGYNPFGLYPQGLTYYDAGSAYRYQYLGTVGNVDLVAALLAISAPVFFLSFLRLTGKSRYLLLIPFGFVLAVTVLSQVAAAYVGVFGGLLLLIPLAAVKTKRKKYLAWIMILVLIFIGIGLIFCFDYGDGTLHEFHELLHGRWDEDFGTGRLFIWRNVLALVPERPFFGGGPDTLGQRMTVEFQRYDAESGVLYRASIDTAHNEYLNILVNEGVLAFVAYLAAFILFLVIFVKENRHNNMLAICGSAVFCYGIQAFFGMRMCLTAPFFWICWALAAGSYLSYKKNENGAKA